MDDDKDMRTKMMPRFQDGNRERNRELVGQWQAIAKKKRCSATQLALAWLLRQGDDVFPIPGTKKVRYLEENWGALEVRLTDDDVEEIRRFVEGAEVAGHYMPPQFESYIFTDTVEEV